MYIAWQRKMASEKRSWMALHRAAMKMIRWMCAVKAFWAMSVTLSCMVIKNTQQRQPSSWEVTTAPYYYWMRLITLSWVYILQIVAVALDWVVLDLQHLWGSWYLDFGLPRCTCLAPPLDLLQQSPWLHFLFSFIWADCNSSLVTLIQYGTNSEVKSHVMFYITLFSSNSHTYLTVYLL